jgi:hypothetical protein
MRFLFRYAAFKELLLRVGVVLRLLFSPLLSLFRFLFFQLSDKQK